MFDKDAPSSQLVLAELKKPGERARLLKYARWRTRDPDEAEDLVADAIILACDPTKSRTWDPARLSFFRHMRRVMDVIAIDRGRYGAGHYEITETALTGKTGDPDAFPDVTDEHEGPEEQLGAGRELEWLRGMAVTLLDGMRERGDQVAIDVYDAACIFEEPSEQAAHLGIPVAEVYEAHRRLRFHGLQVKADWLRREGLRMKEEARRRARPEKDPP